jgi:hypothetical protein
VASNSNGLVEVIYPLLIGFTVATDVLTSTHPSLLDKKHNIYSVSERKQNLHLVSERKYNLRAHIKQYTEFIHLITYIHWVHIFEYLCVHLFNMVVAIIRVRGLIILFLVRRWWVKHCKILVGLIIIYLILERSTGVEGVHDWYLIVQTFGHNHFNIRPIIINI